MITNKWTQIVKTFVADFVIQKTLDHWCDIVDHPWHYIVMDWWASVIVLWHWFSISLHGITALVLHFNACFWLIEELLKKHKRDYRHTAYILAELSFICQVQSRFVFWLTGTNLKGIAEKYDLHRCMWFLTLQGNRLISMPCLSSSIIASPVRSYNFSGRQYP